MFERTEKHIVGFGTYYIKPLSVQALRQAEDNPQRDMAYIALSIVDGAGNPLFSYNNEGFDEIAQLPITTFHQFIEDINKTNQLDKTLREIRQTVENSTLLIDFALAFKLNKTHEEIKQMSYVEYSIWQALFFLDNKAVEPTVDNLQAMVAKVRGMNNGT